MQHIKFMNWRIRFLMSRTDYLFVPLHSVIVFYLHFFSDPIRLGEYPYNTSWYRHISDAYWASSYVDSHYWTMDASKRRFDSGSIGSTPFGFHWYCRWYPWIFWFLQSKRLRFDLIFKFFPSFADKAFKTILSEMHTYLKL